MSTHFSCNLLHFVENLNVRYLFLIFFSMDFWTLMLLPFTEWEILLSSTLFLFILGMAWYMPNSPTGKIWTHYFPQPKKKPTISEMFPYFLGQLILGMIFVHTVMVVWMIANWYGLSQILSSVLVIKAFLGFVFIKELGSWLWEKKDFTLILIQVWYYLIGVLFAVVLLSYMK